MAEDERVWAVKDLLLDYVKSPSLRHIRDPHSINRLAHEIVRYIDARSSVWKKWDGQRELIAKSAIGCWIPLKVLHEFLDEMPGPSLTATDVAQRVNAFIEEDMWSYPNEKLEASCMEIFERERGLGTELPAIIGLLRDHVEREEERLRVEREADYRTWRENDRIAREQRLLAGADCGWTQRKGSLYLYCRKNGRTYRLSPTKDKMWHLHRVSSVSDDEDAPILGRYRTRGDATKVVSQMAYQPEPKW